MGNYISCTLSTPIGGKSSSSATTAVLFPSGEIRQFHEPLKAAELMLEMPNFFVVNSQSLRVGRRFSALAADEDLEMANLYLMFPMKKLNSVISVADMGAMFLAAERVSGRKKPPVAVVIGGGGGGGSVNVSAEESESEGKLKLDDVEEFSSPEMKHRRSMCRSRKPLLETIVEEPILLR